MVAKAPRPAIEKIRSNSEFVISWHVNEDKWGTIWATCHAQLLSYNPEKNQFELNTDIALLRPGVLRKHQHST